MSTVFSRRSFLKYTAVAAVAVAGTSLLGGCSGSGAETAIQTTYPSDNVVLKVKSHIRQRDLYDPYRQRPQVSHRREPQSFCSQGLR